MAEAMSPVPEPVRPLGHPGVEIYRTVSDTHSYRMVAFAEDDSDDALRAARDLALSIEAELWDELSERSLVRTAKRWPQHILDYLAEQGPSSRA
jgi:hypothetical protein